MRGLAISIGAIVLIFVLSPLAQYGVGFILIYLVLPGGICLEIVDFRRRRRTIEKGPSLESFRERIVTERVLVVCPYCGAKNEQGILKCRACGAEV